jgi:hypothetical protein
VPFLSQVAVRRVGLNRWQLLEDLCYRSDRDGRTYTAHRGFVTDWATRPRWVDALLAVVSWLIPKLGRWDEPSVIHDLGCDALREAWRQRRENRRRVKLGLPPLPVREVWRDARGVDQLWFEMLRDQGVGSMTSLILWTAVRWGALGSRYRWAGWWRDAVPVLLSTALFGWIVYVAVRWLDFAAHDLFGG